MVGQIVRPLDVVAAYIPAGRYPLPSTLMMTVIPAQVAGVPTVLRGVAAAGCRDLRARHRCSECRNVFQMGGAQAIAAFAYGTRTVPRADRIVGPGNIYVAAAKKLLAGEVGIDFIAGPTEILIIAHEGEPSWIAADMLAQAEHDMDASAILLTTSKRLAQAVAKEIERQLAVLPTGEVARKAIEKNSAIIFVKSIEEAVEISNRFAPEHLSIPDASSLARHPARRAAFSSAPHSPEAAGDYASGPNHVLPTSGAARLRGGLVGGGLREGDLDSGSQRRRLCAAWLRRLRRWRARKVWRRMRAVSRRDSQERYRMAKRIRPREAVLQMAPYHPPTGGRADKLRLDFNENTIGCSPKVIEFLKQRLEENRLAVYPEYAEAKRELAAYFKVAENEMLLTNGTDEAIQVLDQHLRRR